MEHVEITSLCGHDSILESIVHFYSWMYYSAARQEIRHGSLQHVVDVLFDNQAYQ